MLWPSTSSKHSHTHIPYPKLVGAWCFFFSQERRSSVFCVYVPPEGHIIGPWLPWVVAVVPAESAGRIGGGDFGP